MKILLKFITILVKLLKILMKSLKISVKNLEILELRNTKVTAKGIVSIRKALPKCHITFGPADAPEKSKRK